MSAAAEHERRRVAVGFADGAVLEVLITSADLVALRRALDQPGRGWHELRDGPRGWATVDLERVAWVRTRDVGASDLGF